MNDLKFAFRQLLKNPGFTAVAVLTLALGIGANTAIFSVVNAALLKPLPYPEPERLVAVCESNPSLGWDRYVTSMGAYADWRDENSSFEQLAGAIVLGPTPVVCKTGTELVRVAAVSANFFPLLGIQPLLGRPFVSEEESPDHGDAVLLSEGLWRNRFGADPGILNRPIHLGERSFTVVGVMPAALKLFDPSGVQGWDSGFSECDLWRPLPVNSGLKKQRNYRAFLVLGRLKSGISLAQAQAEMTSIARRQADQFPESNAGWGITVQPWNRIVVRKARLPLLLFLGAVGLVLLIATANIANLHLARAISRQKELTVRLALGASRWRVVRQFLAEGLSLSIIGTVGGLLLGQWSLKVLSGLIPDNVPRIDEIQLDGRVLGFTVATAVGVGLFVALAPVLAFWRSDLRVGLQQCERGSTTSPGGHRLRFLLVTSQVALLLMLLSGAGLLVRSFWRLNAVDPGFRPGQLVAVDALINGPIYTNGFARIQSVETLLKRLSEVPGLAPVAAVDGLPLDPGRGNMDIALTSIEGSLPPAKDEKRVAGLRLVSPGYFQTLGIPLRRGRAFNERDNTNSFPVTIINEALARRYFPGTDPIGKSIGSPDFGPDPCTVVGIVHDVRHASLASHPEPEAFRPLLQECFSSISLVVHSPGGSESGLRQIRDVVASVDRQWPVYHPRPLSDLLADSMAPQRFALVLMELFAGLAVVLAIVGFSGVLACVVGERRHEIAIRLAIGAGRRDITRLIVGHGMQAVAIGGLIGLVGTGMLGRILRNQLYEISPTDPPTLVAVCLLLLAVSSLACWFPARRAAKVDPMEALRSE